MCVVAFCVRLWVITLMICFLLWAFRVAIRLCFVCLMDLVSAPSGNGWVCCGGYSFELYVVSHFIFL